MQNYKNPKKYVVRGRIYMVLHSPCSPQFRPPRMSPFLPQASKGNQLALLMDAI